MKKALVALLFMSLFVVPSSADTMGVDYGFCQQLGVLDNSAAMAVSGIFTANRPIHKQEKEFTKRVLEFKKEFHPSFETSCFSYHSEMKAKKKFDEAVKKALDRKFKVFQVIGEKNN